MKSPLRNILLSIIILAIVLLGWLCFDRYQLKQAHQKLLAAHESTQYLLQQGKMELDSLRTAIDQLTPALPEDAEAPNESSVSTQFINQSGQASIPTERFFTTDVMKGLEPGEKITRFRVGQEVYIYAGIHAPGQETVQLKWFGPDNKLILPSIYKNILRNTGPTGFRIYTYKVFRHPGRYKVQLINGAGKIIGETIFTVVENPQ